MITADDPLLDVAIPYALDAVDDAQRRLIEARRRAAAPHMRRAFDRVVAGIRETMAIASSRTAVSAPARLRTTVLAAVRTDARKSVAANTWRRHRALAAAAAIVAVTGGVIWVSTLPQDRPTNITVEQIVDTAADRRTITAPVSGGGSMTVTFSPRHGAATVRLHDVPELAPQQTYQLWVLGTDVRSAGFAVPGSATVVADALATGKSVAVTIEPAGGSQLPTTTPLAKAEL